MESLTPKQKAAVLALPKSKREAAIRAFRKQRKGKKAKALSAFGYQPAAASDGNPYLAMLLNPSSFSVPRPDMMMAGSRLKQVKYEHVHSEAPTDMLVMYLPRRHKLYVFQGTGDSCELDTDVSASYDPASDYTIGRVIAAELLVVSDVQIGGASDVTGKITAGACQQLYDFRLMTPARAKTIAFSASSVATCSAAEGARVCLPPLGMQDPQLLITAGTLPEDGYLFNRVTNTDFDSTNPGAGGTYHTWTAASAAVPTDNEIPRNASGSLRVSGTITWAAGADASGYIRVSVTRTTGGAAATTDHDVYVTLNQIDTVLSFTDTSPGIIETVTMKAVTVDLGSCGTSEVTLEFLSSSALINEPALYAVVDGMQASQSMRVTVNSVYELLPGVALAQALPDEPSVRNTAHSSHLEEVIANVEMIPWAHTNGAQAASVKDIWRKFTRGVRVAGRTARRVASDPVLGNFVPPLARTVLQAPLVGELLQ